MASALVNTGLTISCCFFHMSSLVQSADSSTTCLLTATASGPLAAILPANALAASRALPAGKSLVAFEGRQIVTLVGKKAELFLSRIEGVDPRRAQLLMAKATGNFKRGS